MNSVSRLHSLAVWKGTMNPRKLRFHCCFHRGYKRIKKYCFYECRFMSNDTMNLFYIWFSFFLFSFFFLLELSFGINYDFVIKFWNK